MHKIDIPLLPRTHKIFLESAYATECEAEILYVQDNIIILDKTLFYATSGGQPGDKGLLLLSDGSPIDIVDTFYVDNKKTIAHKISDNTPEILLKKMSINDTITLQIDWHNRYQNMQMHTVLHIISGLLDDKITGCQIDGHKARIDFNLTQDVPQKEALTDEINQIIRQRLAVNHFWLDVKTLEERPELVKSLSVSPPKDEDQVRFIEIKTHDLQPCGGTHVKNTQEIAEVVVNKIHNKGAKNRRINLHFV